MYSQPKINKAFALFCQDPSTKNRDALMAECKDLIQVVLCSTTPWVSEDPETKNEIRIDVLVLLMEFLDRRKGFDQVRNPTAFLNAFLKRNILNCLKARYPSEHPALKPDQFLPMEVEKEGWTRFEDEMVVETDYAVARAKAEARRGLKSWLGFFRSERSKWRKNGPTNRYMAKILLSPKIKVIKETLKKKTTSEK